MIKKLICLAVLSGASFGCMATSAPSTLYMDHVIAQRDAEATKKRSFSIKRAISMKRVSSMHMKKNHVDEETNPYKKLLWEIFYSGSLETFIIKPTFKIFIEKLRVAMKSADFDRARDGWFAERRGEDLCEIVFGFSSKNMNLRLDDDEIKELLEEHYLDTLLTILSERVVLENGTMLTEANFKSFIEELANSMVLEARGIYLVRTVEANPTQVTIVPRYRKECIEMFLSGMHDPEIDLAVPSSSSSPAEYPSDLRGFPSMPCVPSAMEAIERSRSSTFNIPHHLSKKARRLSKAIRDSGF